MNVLIVSQCSKNALQQSRRILDQFAERKGERTWQTAITWDGLDTLRRLLKKTARKNTAVACHWIRGRDNTELLWIVGNAAQFNHQGAVPTHTTEKDVLRTRDEDDWHTAEEIRLLAAMAALFHDVGKANKTFQEKLKSKKPVADPFRHEWVSVRLFEAFVGGSEDRVWLDRLATLPDKPDLAWMCSVIRDGEGKSHLSPFKNLKPLARVVAWLIISHHRLPMQGRENDENIKLLKRLPAGIYESWCGSRLEAEQLEADERQKKEQAIRDCWDFEHFVPFTSVVWRSRARKQAQRMLCVSSFVRGGLADGQYLCAAPGPSGVDAFRPSLLQSNRTKATRERRPRIPSLRQYPPRYRGTQPTLG